MATRDYNKKEDQQLEVYHWIRHMDIGVLDINTTLWVQRDDSTHYHICRRNDSNKFVFIVGFMRGCQ